MTDKLKPCPFCGGEAQLMINELEDTQEGTVMCMTCYVTSTTQKSDNWKEAIEAWNTRAQEPVDVDKLKEGLKLKPLKFWEHTSSNIHSRIVAKKIIDDVIDHLAEQGHLRTKPDNTEAKEDTEYNNYALDSLVKYAKSNDDNSYALSYDECNGVDAEIK